MRSYKMLELMRSAHVVLLTGVMCVVQSWALLCPYNHKDCLKCDDYSVTCANLTHIPLLNAGADVYPVQRVVFMDGTISSISKTSLPPGLRTIHMQGLPLNNILEDAFDTSATTLTRLHFGDAKFDSLPEALNKLRALGELSIENTRIIYWDSNLLQHIAPRLESLELRNVGLSSWPSWISDFNLLHTLDLSNNFLTYIPDDAFSSIRDSLQTLYLSGTGLTHIPQALSVLSNLRNLYLSNNNFADVNEIQKITGFSFARELVELTLASTRLSKSANFSSLTSLTFLNLDNNKIRNILPGSLPWSLTKLYLSYNRLSSVPKDIASMSKLAMLKMTDNLFSMITRNSFPLSLEYLILEANKITKILRRTFGNLRHLQVLTLASNPISQISPAAFSDLVSLSVLTISSQPAEIPLAFTKLHPFVNIIFFTNKELSCPCPTPKELIDWFDAGVSLRQFPYSCSSGQSVFSYLGGQCG